MNVMGGHTGKWALSFAHNASTLGSAVQDVTLPNGVYTLKVWAKSSGGQPLARLYAVGHGGPEIAYEFNGPLAEWTR